MSQVNTIMGPVDAASLGATLMHEHIFVLSPEIHQNYPEDWGDEAVRIHTAVSRLRELKSRGIDSLVDMTVIGLGRNIHRIREIAGQVEVNILAAAGLYVFEELPLYFQGRDLAGRGGAASRIMEMLLRDIREGIAGTGIKAAILKCATGRKGMTPVTELMLRATARAQRETGVPLYTHTHAGSRGGLQQQRLFAEEGVDLERVVIGHCGDTTSMDYLERLLEKGSYLGMDRFGIDRILSFDRRVDTVATLCRRGYAEKMVLSHDAACYNDSVPDAFAALMPDWNYLHIPKDVVPALKTRGISDRDIRAMLVDNPRALLKPA